MDRFTPHGDGRRRDPDALAVVIFIVASAAAFTAGTTFLLLFR